MNLTGVRRGWAFRTTTYCTRPGCQTRVCSRGGYVRREVCSQKACLSTISSTTKPTWIKLGPLRLEAVDQSSDSSIYDSETYIHDKCSHKTDIRELPYIYDTSVTSFVFCDLAPSLLFLCSSHFVLPKCQCETPIHLIGRCLLLRNVLTYWHIMEGRYNPTHS
jgi:hypothetical protein